MIHLQLHTGCILLRSTNSSVCLGLEMMLILDSLVIPKETYKLKVKPLFFYGKFSSLNDGGKWNFYFENKENSFVEACNQKSNKLNEKMNYSQEMSTILINIFKLVEQSFNLFNLGWSLGNIDRYNRWRISQFSTRCKFD